MHHHKSHRVFRSVLDAQMRERRLIIVEASRIKGLMPLLMKRRNGSDWTSAERAELHAQMRALMHLSPYLAVLALPGSFLFLPLLAWWLDRRRVPRRSELAAVEAVEATVPITFPDKDT